MIDFGLVTLFALQILLLAGVYHVFTRIKEETKDVLSFKDDIHRSLELAKANRDEVAGFFSGIDERVRAAEAVPQSLTKRVIAIEDNAKTLDRALDGVRDRVTSLGARISSSMRRGKKSAEEVAPALEDEEGFQLEAELPPGPTIIEPESQVRPGFGVLKRRVS